MFYIEAELYGIRWFDNSDNNSICVSKCHRYINTNSNSQDPQTKGTAVTMRKDTTIYIFVIKVR